jgi:hypothetical protein
MSAELLQKRFKETYTKKRKEMEDSSRKKNVKKTRKSENKARRWALVKTLFEVSRPTYIYAGGYQLVTVIVQAANPLVVQHLLRLVENYPNESIFSRGIGFAIALFLICVVDGLAQERHKYLAFQSGIRRRRDWMHVRELRSFWNAKLLQKNHLRT